MLIGNINRTGNTFKSIFICVGLTLALTLGELPNVYAYDTTPRNKQHSDDIHNLVKLGKRGGDLSPTGNNFNASDNAAFKRAMEDWNAHNWKSAVSKFKAHTKAYPNSPWAAESELHMGCFYRYTNELDSAKSQFTKIMEKYPGTDVAHKAKKRLGGTYYLSGDYQKSLDTYKALAADKDVSPRHRTYALHWRRDLERMIKHQPKTQAQRLNQCGLKSLALLYQQNDLPRRAMEMEALAGKSENESNFLELLHHVKNEYPHSAVLETDIQILDKLQLPAIAYQDKSHHFVVVSQIQGDSIVIRDPYKGEKTLSRSEFEEEWSGQLLVTDKGLTGDALNKIKIVSNENLEVTTGGCCGNPLPEGGLGGGGPEAGGGGPDGGGPDGDGSDGGGPDGGGPDGGEPDADGPKPPCGNPVYSFNMSNLNMLVRDIPLYYTPGKGLPVQVEMTFNSGDAAPPSYLGNKWSLNYDTHYILDPSDNVTIIRPDGRRDTYTRNGDNSLSPPDGSNEPFPVDDTLVDDGAGEYTLTLKKEKIKYHYNADQSLAWMEDRWGNRLSFFYDAGNNLDYMTDALGAVIDFVLYGDGKIWKIILPDTRYAEFTYDLNGNLETVRDMAGYMSSYTYQANTSNNADLLATYDITSITTPKGTTNFNYSYPDGSAFGTWDNFSIVATNLKGEITEYYWDAAQAIPSVTYGINTNAMDDNRIEWAERLTGYSTYYNLDSFARVTNIYREIDEDLGGIAFRIGNEPYVTTTYAYSNNRLQTTTDAYGKTITLGYDANNNINSIKDQYNKETLLNYDTNDNLIDVTDPNGVIKRYEYDANDALKKVIRDRTDPMPDIVTELFYMSYGKVDYVINPKGKTIDYGYNASGQLTSILTPAGYALNMEYDGSGRLWKLKDNTNMVLETYGYDDLNRRIRTDYADGTYEEFTRTCCQVDTYRDRGGNITAYGYDLAGRLETITHPDTGVTTYLYDKAGRINGIRDAENKTTSYTLNPAGWVMGETRPDGSVIDYERDALGRLSKQTRAGRSVDFQYYDNSRLRRIDFADGSYRDYTYYDNGKLNTLTNANGTFTWNYDDVNRLETFDGPGTGDTQTFGYDELFNLTSLNDPRYGTVQYQYDYDKNRLWKVIAPDLREFAYSYTPDVFLKLDTITYPNNTVVDYGYDAYHRANSIVHKNSAAAVLASHSYTHNNKQYFDNHTLSDGRYSDYTYDANGRLDTAILKNANTTPIQSDDYDYDKVGNRTLFTRNGSSQTYTPNALNQPIWQAASPGTGTFNTSLTGNVTDSFSPVQSLTINGANVSIDGSGNYNHPVTLNVGENIFTLAATDSASNVQTLTRTMFYGIDTSWVYDGWGNLTDKTSALTSTKEIFTHNVQNRLTAYSKTVSGVPTTSASYQYDIFNRRTQKIVDGTETNYIYGNEDILIEQDDTNTTIATYIHAPGIDQPLSMTRGGQHYYYHTDMLGSITAVTDSTEAVVQSYEYDAYGNITAELDAAFISPYTYTGRERDKESNLYYYRARYYDASRGSFIEEDPIGLLGGINMYGYVVGNPVNFIDPFGLEARWEQTGGQEGTGGSAEVTYTCICDNGDQVATVTRDGYGDDAGWLDLRTRQELDRDYDPNLYCGK